MSWLLPLFILLGQSPLGTKAPTLVTSEDVSAALKKAIVERYPKASISVTKETFTAKANTMQFTLHGIARDGRISEETHQEEGPQYDGFLLSVTRSPGRYTGPLMTPQMLQKPYWATLVNEIPNAKTGTHLWVIYSYGVRVDPELHKQILAALGKRQAGAPRR